MQSDYDVLNELNTRQRAILSVFCGNDYIGHLYMFTIGQKDAEGRRGRAFKAAVQYSSLTDPQARLQYLHAVPAFAGTR